MNFVVRDDGHSGTGAQVPNWEYYVTNERAALIELPETGALLELARATPALDQVMLHGGSGDAIAPDSLRAHLVDSYLIPLTVAILKRAGEGQAAAFSTVYGQFEKFLFHYKELSFSILVQFSNFRSDVPEIELEPGVRIRHATAAEQALALRSEMGPTLFGAISAALMDTELLHYSRFPTDLDSTPYVFLEIDLLYGRYPHARPNTGFTYDDGYERAEQLLSGLHLLDDHFVVGHSLWYVDTNPFQRFGPRMIEYSRRKVPPSGSGGHYVLNEEKARKLQEMWPALASSDRDPRIELALRRLESTYERRMLEDKILDYWIALEALFLPTQETELNFRATLRIARYLGQSHDERVEIFNTIKDSYAVRSKVVHGERLKKSIDLEMTATQTGALLRKALEQALTSGKPPDVKKLDLDLLL